MVSTGGLSQPEWSQPVHLLWPESWNPDLETGDPEGPPPSGRDGRPGGLDEREDDPQDLGCNSIEKYWLEFKLEIPVWFWYTSELQGDHSGRLKPPVDFKFITRHVNSEGHFVSFSNLGLGSDVVAKQEPVHQHHNHNATYRFSTYKILSTIDMPSYEIEVNGRF